VAHKLSARQCIGHFWDRSREEKRNANLHSPMSRPLPSSDAVDTDGFLRPDNEHIIGDRVDNTHLQMRYYQYYGLNSKLNLSFYFRFVANEHWCHVYNFQKREAPSGFEPIFPASNLSIKLITFKFKNPANQVVPGLFTQIELRKQSGNNLHIWYFWILTQILELLESNQLFFKKL